MMEIVLNLKLLTNGIQYIKIIILSNIVEQLRKHLASMIEEDKQKELDFDKIA